MRLLRTVVPLAALFAASTAHAEPKPSSPSDAPGPSRGIDLAGMDRSVAPGDDFFDYANGTWVKKTPIPADKPAWGVLGELAEETIRRTRSLLEEASAAKAPPGSELRKVGDLYAGFMDESAIEKKGIAPLKPALARIAAVRDKTQLARLLGEDLRADVDPLNNSTFYTPRLLGLWVAPDFNAPGQYAPYLLQGGLGMPDREFYLDGSPRMADIRTKYRAHVATVLKLAGVAAAAAKAARIVALETKIAKVHASREESVDVLKANNPWKRSEFAAKAPGLDWDTYFAAASLDKVPMIVVWHPGATKGLSALVAAEALADWKDWLTYHAVETRSAFLPRALADEHFAFFGKVLAGTPKQSDRWKRGVAFANALLGDAVGHIYVKKYFPAESKAQLQAMVKNIIAAFRARIDKIEWMTAATKAKAKEKLGTLYVGVGYPDKWVDYATLEIARDDVVGNVDRAGAFEYRRSLAKLGKPVDMTEWCMTPQTVNAVNLPLQNALNFPAAILQPPFFDPGAPAAVNYGSIGSVIGHEISHSFDDQGAQFDARGTLADWWTKEDRAHFEAAGAQLAAQYDAYRPFPDVHLNGKLTLGENIADLAGLAATHDAWLASLDGKPAPVAQGMSGEQQLFLAFAQAWRGVIREPLLRQLMIVDGHSPSKYRALTVRNLDAWYAAFDVKSGQAMYLAPKDRVRVW
ncbi:MAG TPA: M13 family metallopeptidase [Haliangiales bacterium]|nr:M13 family metallopeptidase [Haliangiales bacterium]